MYTLVAPGPLPMKLVDVKSHLRVDNDVDNGLIQNLIQAATTYAEGETGRDLRVNAWSLQLREFPSTPICIRKNLVTTITAIKYFVATVETTIASSVYLWVPATHYGSIELKTGQSWPTDMDDDTFITVTFSTVVPRNLERAKQGMLKHIANLYQNRGDCDITDSARKSGAVAIYNQPGMKIVRV